MRKLFFSFFTLLFISTLATSQEVNQNRKQLTTIRVSKAPKIDGVLDDEAWKGVDVAKDFFVLRPDNGNKAPNTHQTEVRVVYDNQAIYISADMTDPDPENIPMEFTYRDNFGQADFFLVTINPNDDGQNPFQFVVMSSGAQAEARVSSGNEDFSWNAVWESDAKINLSRYKGLGEMNAEQLWETTMDPEKRTLLQVTMEDAEGANEIFTKLMGEEVEPRREFIVTQAKFVANLDI